MDGNLEIVCLNLDSLYELFLIIKILHIDILLFGMFLTHNKLFRTNILLEREQFFFPMLLILNPNSHVTSHGLQGPKPSSYPTLPQEGGKVNFYSMDCVTLVLS